jgi:hypothetical protein
VNETEIVKRWHNAKADYRERYSFPLGGLFDAGDALCATVARLEGEADVLIRLARTARATMDCLAEFGAFDTEKAGYCSEWVEALEESIREAMPIFLRVESAATAPAAGSGGAVTYPLSVLDEGEAPEVGRYGDEE